MRDEDLQYLVQRVKELKLLEDPRIADWITNGPKPDFPNGRPDVILISTRAPKEPLSGGLAPAMREATYGQNVIWYALSRREKEPPETRLARALAMAAMDISIRSRHYDEAGFKVREIQALEDHYDDHYIGWANRVSWFVNHDLTDFAEQPTLWARHGNQHVNDMIARAIAEDVQHDSTVPIWFQDYQHPTLGSALRNHGLKNPLVYFHHTPWPSVETLEVMGPRTKAIYEETANALLECDAVVFQTSETLRRFLKTLGYRNPPDVDPYDGVIIPIHNQAGQHIRNVYVAHAPISINTKKVMEIVNSGVGIQSEAARELDEKLVAPFVFVGFERADPSKGILPRVKALEVLLQRRPEFIGQVQMMLVAEPSRTDINIYVDYAKEVGEYAEGLNTQYANPTLPPPVIFHNRNIPNPDLLHMMQSRPGQRRISCVSGFRDGKNLTAKEFAAVQKLDCAGPLIISSGVGAAPELKLNDKGALVYDPSETDDVTALADAMERAIDMEQAEVNRRAAAMQAQVIENDIGKWSGFHNNLFADISAGRYTPQAAARKVLQPRQLII